MDITKSLRNIAPDSCLIYENAVDNRDNPPDDGVLIWIGGYAGDRGDFVRLSIRKMPILGAPSSSCNRSKKKKST